MRTRRLAALVVVITTLLTLGACTDSPDEGPAMSDSTPLSTAAPSGEEVCGFLSEESIATALGTTDFSTSGSVNRDGSGFFNGTSCSARLEGEPLDSLQVTVNLMMGMTRASFERGLQNSDNSQLPAAQGLGYSWTEEQETGEGTQVLGRALLSRGEHLIKVSLVAADGRDPAEDAMRLALQADAALDMPDRWTLDGEPPSR